VPVGSQIVLVVVLVIDFPIGEKVSNSCTRAIAIFHPRLDIGKSRCLFIPG
jgi:hypothetical protein